MKKIISNVIGTFEFQIKEANIKLEIKELPSCYGDEVQINQVFSNLVGNAIKYLDNDRAGIINVSGQKRNGQVEYCIEDNGIGIAKKNQEKIFNIFGRVKPDDNKGEGLGLAIVRKILSRHNGKIWLKSEFEKGSKFYVSLQANSS